MTAPVNHKKILKVMPLAWKRETTIVSVRWGVKMSLGILRVETKQ